MFIADVGTSSSDHEPRHLVVVDDDREHPYRQLDELFRPVRNAAAERERIAGREQVARLAMTVAQPSCENIDELDARMLEAGKDLALVVERDEERLEDASRTALDRQQVIGMSTSGAAAYDLGRMPAPHVLRAPRLGRVAGK